MHDAVYTGLEFRPYRDDHALFTLGSVGILQCFADTFCFEETLQTFFQLAFGCLGITDGLPQFRRGVFPDVSFIIYTTDQFL